MKKGFTLCLTTLMISLSAQGLANQKDLQDEWQLGFSSSALNGTDDSQELQVASEMLYQAEEENNREGKAFIKQQQDLKELTSAKRKWLKTPFPLHQEFKTSSTLRKSALPLPFPQHDTTREEGLKASIIKKRTRHFQEKLSLEEYLDVMGVKEQTSFKVAPLKVKTLPSSVPTELSESPLNKDATLETSKEPLLDALQVVDALPLPASGLSSKVSQEFYSDEEVSIFSLTAGEATLLTHKETELKEEESLKLRDIAAELEGKFVDFSSSMMPSNLEIAFNLADGNHWQVMQALSPEKEEEQKASFLDPFNLGDARAVDFPLDLIEKQVIQVVEEKLAFENFEHQINPNDLSLQEVEKKLLPEEHYRPLDFPLDLLENDVSSLSALGEQMPRAMPLSLSLPEKDFIAQTNAFKWLSSHSLFQQALQELNEQQKKTASLSLTSKVSLASEETPKAKESSVALFDVKKLFIPTEEKFLPKMQGFSAPIIKKESSLADFEPRDWEEEKAMPSDWEEEKAMPRESLELSPHVVEQMALEKNNQILVKRKELEAAEYEYLQVVSRFYPKVTLSSEYRRRSNVEGSSSSRELSGIVRLDQKLISTDSYYDIKKGYMSFERKKLDLVYLENAILFDAREAYFKTVLSSQEIAVNQDNISRLKQAVQREEKRLGIGDAIQLDLEQSKVDLSNAFISYYKAIRDFKVNLNRLANIIGLEGQDHRLIKIVQNEIPVKDIKDIQEKIQLLQDQKQKQKGRLKQALFTESEMLKWENVALKLHPQMGQIRLEEKEARTNLEQKMGHYYPQLNAFANYRRGQSSTDWSAGLSLDWDLFDGLGREYRIQESSGLSLSKKLEHVKLQESIRTDIRDKIYDMEASLLSYLSAKKSLSLSQASHDLAAKRREAGDITNLEYREVSKALKESQYHFHNQEYNLLMAYFQLRKESGLDIGNIVFNEIEPSVFHEVFENFGEKLQFLQP